MLKLTKAEAKRLRSSIIEDLCDPERKTPAQSVELKLKVLLENPGDNDKDTLPKLEVEDINEDDIGDFPTMH